MTCPEPTIHHDSSTSSEVNVLEKRRPDWPTIVITILASFFVIVMLAVIASPLAFNFMLHSNLNNFSILNSFDDFESFARPLDDLAREHGFRIDNTRSGWGGAAFDFMSETQRQSCFRASADIGLDFRKYVERGSHLESEIRWLVTEYFVDLESVRLIGIFDGDSFDENSTMVGAYIELNHSLIMSLEEASRIKGFTPDGTISLDDAIEQHRIASDEALRSVEHSVIEYSLAPDMLLEAQQSGPEYILTNYILALAAGDVERARALSAHPGTWLADFDLDLQRRQAHITEDATSVELVSIRDATGDLGWPIDHAIGQFSDYTDITCFSLSITINGQRNHFTQTPFYLGKNTAGQWRVLLPSGDWDW